MPEVLEKSLGSINCAPFIFKYNYVTLYASTDATGHSLLKAVDLSTSEIYHNGKSCI